MAVWHNPVFCVQGFRGLGQSGWRQQPTRHHLSGVTHLSEHTGQRQGDNTLHFLKIRTKRVRIWSFIVVWELWTGSPPPQLSGGCELTVVIHDFMASNSNELNMRRGQTVEVLERCHDRPDWCLVRTTDRSPALEGLVPCAMLCIAHSRSSMEMEGIFNHKGSDPTAAVLICRDFHIQTTSFSGFCLDLYVINQNVVHDCEEEGKFDNFSLETS